MSTLNVRVWTVIYTAVILLRVPTISATEFSVGTGKPDDPFHISTPDELILIGSDPDLLDKHFVLVEDIDLDPNLAGEHIFTQAVIAPDAETDEGFQGPPFSGSLDGRGHVIRHLTIQSGSAHFLGLFGKIGMNGRVHRIGLKGVRIVGGRGSFCVGGLAGDNWGNIVCCYASGRIDSSDSSSCVGGLVGRNSQGRILNCYAKGGLVTGDNSGKIGGLVGQHGGFIYDPDLDRIITAAGRITHCLAAVHIATSQSAHNVGGLVGYNDRRSIVRRCFWDTEVSGVSVSGGGAGLKTGEMHDIDTYMTAGWDMAGERSNGTTDVWLMPENEGYPVLAITSTAYQRRLLKGAGTLDDPYIVTTPEDIGAIHHYDWSSYYKLGADIDLAGITWTTAPIWTFEGAFDGDGFTVSNLSICGQERLGLFGFLGLDAEVRDLCVRDVNIVGEDDAMWVGALAGRNDGSVIDCSGSGCFTGHMRASVGGLVGMNEGEILHSSADVRLTGTADSAFVGGLVGSNVGVIGESFVCAAVSGNSDLGGIAGLNEGRVYASYAQGKLSANRMLGGLVGSNWRGSIVDCYAITRLSCGGTSCPDMGGLVGGNEDGLIDRCYALGNLVGSQTVNAITTRAYYLRDSHATSVNGHGVPLSDEEMKQQSSFAGWDFKNVWMICEGKEYPHLRWENLRCHNSKSGDTQGDSAKQ